MKLILTLIVIVASAGYAQATPPGQTEAFHPIVVDEKSETTATVLTVAGIATPVALTALLYEPDTDNPMYLPVGLMTGLFMPAIGHWYTRKVGTYGMLIRLGGFTMLGVGLGYLADANNCDRGIEVEDGCLGNERGIGRVALGLGAATWAGSWVYDIWSARREVRHWNSRKTLHLLPITTQHTTGVALGGTF